MTSRIHRGFHRIGVVLAGLAILLDVALVLGNQLKSALHLLVVAVALYVAVRAVGWILAGFLGTGNHT